MLLMLAPKAVEKGPQRTRARGGRLADTGRGRVPLGQQGGAHLSWQIQVSPAWIRLASEVGRSSQDRRPKAEGAAVTLAMVCVLPCVDKAVCPSERKAP